MLPSLVIAPRLSPVGLFSEEDVVSADFVFTLSCTRSSDALPGLAPFRSATVSPSCVQGRSAATSAQRRLLRQRETQLPEHQPTMLFSTARGVHASASAGADPSTILLNV
jgi:hypothetical protein